MLLLNGLSHRLAPGRRLVQGELLKHLAAGAQAASTPTLPARNAPLGPGSDAGRVRSTPPGR
jgi:ubiquinone biosynthesis protein